MEKFNCQISMSDSGHITIIKAEFKHLPKMLSILEKSFAGVPGVTEWIVKKDQKYNKRLRLWLEIFLKRAIRFKHVYYAPMESCVAIWYPPDAWKLGLIQQLIWFPKLLQVTDINQLWDKVTVLLKMANRHPKEPHFYLSLIGTAPCKRGKGIGSLMLNYGLNICKDHNLPVYVESNESAYPFYKRHGFYTLNEFILPKSEIKMRAMWFP